MKDVSQEAPKVEIVPFEESVIAQAFKQENGVMDLFEEMKSKVASLVFDAEDPKARAEMKSIAYAISRSKTTVDDFGKDLVSGIKNQAKLIDSQRKDWRESCDKLRDHVRAPLDAWEAQEEAKNQVFADRLRSIEVIRDQDYQYHSAAQIKEILSSLKSAKITDEDYADLVPQAKLAKFEAIEVLDAALENAEAREAEQKKQAEIQEQQRLDREEQIRKEAKEQADRQAEIRIKQAELHAREKLEREQAEKAKNSSLRNKAMLEAVDSLCASGFVDEDTAKALVKAVYNGEIKNFKLIF